MAERHAGWGLEQVRAIDCMLTGWDEAEAADRLRRLWPNLRAAVDRAITHGDAHLAVGIGAARSEWRLV